MFTYHNYQTQQWLGQHITRQEADMLFILHARHGIVSYDDITDFLWENPDDSPLDICSLINQIALKLRRKFGKNMIVTHCTRGYEIDINQR
jgi:DNA-binding winged helix-turn-helix (wHTH) protein